MDGKKESRSFGKVSGAGEPPPCGRVAAHLTVRSPHRSPPADFPHEPLQQLIHSTARDCILAKGMYNLGHRSGNDFSAILSSPVCMAGLLLSLNKGPIPPFAWSPCFPQKAQLPLTASPCSRLSLPQSTIS